MKARIVASTITICASIIFGTISVAAAIASWQLIDSRDAPAIFPLSEYYYNLSTSEQDAGRSVTFAEAAVAASKCRAENWVLLAWAFEKNDGRFSARSLTALRRSYAASKLSVDAAQYRISFSLYNFKQLPSDVRDSLVFEIRNFALTQTGQEYLRGAMKTISDPDVRMLLAVLILNAQHTREANAVKWRVMHQFTQDARM